MKIKHTRNQRKALEKIGGIRTKSLEPELLTNLGCRNKYQMNALAMYYDPKKVQVGKDQEKAQSEKDSHSKNRGGKKPN